MGKYNNHDLIESDVDQVGLPRSSVPTLISLIEGVDGSRMVSFGGNPWHGTWYFIAAPPLLVIDFDCKARGDRLKTTTLRRQSPGIWEGHDYQGRLITIRFHSAMIYAQNSGWVDLDIPAPGVRSLPDEFVGSLEDASD